MRSTGLGHVFTSDSLKARLLRPPQSDRSRRLPLVATDAPGCGEIVQHGVNGLLVPIQDATALAAALQRLCREPETRQRLGQASRARALAEFDERIVFEQTRAVYEELRH